MKNMELKIVGLYAILILFLLFGHIIFVEELVSYEALKTIVWLAICLLTYVITKGEKGRYKAKSDKVQTIFIIVLVYLMIYFTSGLVLGYVRSPYSHSFIGILENTWTFLTIIIFQEYIRSVLVGYTRKKKYLYVLIVLIFTLFEVNFYHITDNFTSGEAGFKYISSAIFPKLVENCLFTYLATVAGTLASLVYRLPIALATIVLPILPDFNWFLTGITGSLLPLFIYLFINRIDEEKRVRSRRRQSNFSDLPSTILFIMFVFFISGLFKYKPIAVMSNSMADVFYRGDVVIIEKITNVDELDVQNIILYELDGTKIMHRIIETKIKDDGTKLYRTKGDNNNTPDTEWVEPSQVIGIVRLKIPKIGYPSVWLNEMIHPNSPTNVEAPK